jgi:glycosyltransferase involved in cell wall biosynthesis
VNLSPSLPTGTRVSVVIPSFNMGWCVAQAVESVLSQDHPDVQVIVVDDGSTDDTAQRLAPFGRRIEVLRQPNRGLAAARNAGARHATGDYLVFLDADDLLLPGKLSAQWQALQARPDCAAVYSDGWLATSEGRRLHRFSDEFTPGLFSHDGAARLRRLLLRGQPPPVHCVMLRRAAMLEVGLFDESYSAREDLEFWLRFSAVHAVAYLPGELVVYVVREDSMSRSSERMQTQSARLYRVMSRDPEFIGRPAAERAAHLRAWAMEVGVQHHGPWSGAGRDALGFALEARSLEPWNWRSQLLPLLLAHRGTAGLLKWFLAKARRTPVGAA